MNIRLLLTCLSAVTLALQAYAQAPSAPVNLAAAPSTLSPVAGAYQVKVTWEDGPQPGDSYELQRREWSSGEWVTLPVIRYLGNEYHDRNSGEGLKAATQYFYRVRASDNGNYSPFSNVASVTTAAASASVFLEAENGELWGAVAAADRPGYTGTGFVDFVASSDERLVLRPELPQPGIYRAEFRYANGGTSGRAMELKIDGLMVAPSFSFAPTGGWNTWATASATVSFPSFSLGGHDSFSGPRSGLSLRSTGASGPNIDSVRIVPVFTGARINFQPAGVPVPPGYIADTGAVYGSRGNGFTYGWNAVNSNETRDRNNALSPDQRYDTLAQTQRGGNFFWELAVPNGRYGVTLVMGDPSFTDSVYAASIEGVLTTPVTPTSTRRWTEQFRIVNVTDGRLTIRNATGAVNNKFAFVEAYPRHPQTVVLQEDFNNAGDTRFEGWEIANGVARPVSSSFLLMRVGGYTDYVIETRVKGLDASSERSGHYTFAFGRLIQDWDNWDVRDRSFNYYSLRINPGEKLVYLDRTFQNPRESIYTDPVSETIASAPLALPHDSYSTWKIVRDGRTGRIQVYVDQGSGYAATPLFDVVDWRTPAVGSVVWDISQSPDPGFLIDSIKVNAVASPQ